MMEVGAHRLFQDKEVNMKLRGYPGVQKHYRTTGTILTIKVSCVGQSQPLTHTIAQPQYVKGTMGILDTTGISHSDPWISP